jgi:two-component system response regulator (stage 0 sporulation protein F)
MGDMSTILVVDDEEEICSLTKSILVKKDYNVLVAKNGSDALDFVAKEHPELVLLDVRLGEVSGIDVLRKIKEIDNKIKVIMVTGLYEEEIINQAKALGAQDYITKPFTIAYLKELVARELSP